MKTVCPRGRVGSNPTLSALQKLPSFILVVFYMSKYARKLLVTFLYGEIPKLAEGAPLERE